MKAWHSRKRYVLVFDKDGSFTINDVAPGNYELKIQLSDPGAPVAYGFGGMYKSVSKLTKEVTIPETFGTGPFDLGVLELK